jgi:ATP-dependent RNA helicase DeaD
MGGAAHAATRFEAIRQGAQIVIGTPGRVLDHLRRGELSTPATCAWWLLDESDEMLSMGFLPQINDIFSCLAGIETNLHF